MLDLGWVGFWSAGGSVGRSLAQVTPVSRLAPPFSAPSSLVALLKRPSSGKFGASDYET